MSALPLPRVEWSPSIPPEVRGAVEPLLAAALDLTPRWLREIFVEYDHEAESPASILMECDYGVSKLRIGARFIECTPDERLPIIEHEMLHVAQSPMYGVVEDITEHLKRDNEELAKWFHTQFERATERTNCDLCDILARRRRG